jgi:hypothetical protein
MTGTKIKANRDMLKVEELVEVINRSEEDISRYLERDRLDSIEEEQERLAEIRREKGRSFEQQTKLEKEQFNKN